MASDRLHKIMATAGLGSRRAIEKKIAGGAVRLNQAVVSPGVSAEPGDIVEMDGGRWRVVEKRARFRTLIYNKPEGEVSTRSDPEGRPTVFDRLPKLENQRWISVGRLDINTSGLLLLTTDGELANVMMHPSGGVDREYACRIRGEVSEAHLQNLRQGVELEDGMANFSDIQPGGGPGSGSGAGSGSNRWFYVVLMEGRNREVRRLWESQGLQVSRLKRVRYGAAFLPKHMHVGRWREITPEEHQVLREDVGLNGATGVLTLERLDGPGKLRGKQPGKRPRKVSRKKRDR